MSDLLSQLPSQPRPAWRLCEALGGLARWCLRPSVLRLAEQYASLSPSPRRRPRRRMRPGDCQALFRAEKAFPALRPAFVLPLAWRHAAAHSCHLPEAMADLAGRVARDLGARPGFGLFPADELGPPRPAWVGLRLKCDSAWAALAGGLLTLSEGLTPKPDVWATGAWSEKGSGLAEIQGLYAKLRLAVRWKAKHLFVPHWDAEKAVAWVQTNAAGRLLIGALASTPKPQPRVTLNEFVARLAEQLPVPPEGGPDEPGLFEQCQNYYLHLDAHSVMGREFYRTHLLPGILCRLQKKVEQGWPSLGATHYVTLVSHSPELAVLGPLAVGASRCLLLHSRDAADSASKKKMSEEADRCADALRRMDVSVAKPVAFDTGPEMQADILRAVAEFTEGVEPSRVVFDMKPGTKKMTLAVREAARPGNWLFNLDSDYEGERHQNGPGSEVPELRQVR